MLVSIIIPFYSNIQWLSEALNSIKSQDFNGEFEVILIDDGSQENSEELLKTYAFKSKFLKIPNGGAAIARNYGIELATGKYIAFLDSDDIWTNSKLDIQTNYMESNNLVWSHTGFENFDEETKEIINSVLPKKFRGNIFLKALISCPIATPTIMARRKEILENNFKFHPKMRQGQDTYLWYSLSEKYPLGYINKCLAQIRIRNNNTSFSVSNHFRVKAQLWGFFLKDRKQVPFRITFSYWLAYQNYEIIGKFFERRLSKKGFDLISRLLYFIPYILLKIQKSKYN